MPPKDRQTLSLQNTKSKVNIIRYNSDVATSNSKIKLAQNLFSFLLEGNKSVQYAGTKVTINTNQFFLLSAGNCLMSEKIATPGGQYRSLLFFFDNELLTDFFMRHPVQTNPLKSKPKEEPFVVFEKDAFLTNFVDSLGLILASGQSLSKELESVKLEELLIYISGCYPELLRGFNDYNYSSDKVFLIRQVITANIYNVMTVEELAFLCSMTLSTFKRNFAELYGTSPKKWFLEKRMQKAAQMLRKSDLHSSEIYLELGYENLSSFIQSFKQIYGTTPKQYQLNKLNV
ncbi:helix-turn-helix domain-containing protein [Pedobacter petrophilus]|uniref:Helix-turn-helix domain-containing protein n=1 Tax=Pedobacter petrophilus TaxID=1908241 RepID=A0A7K0FVF0_9SPHI|nr:AraC family transcriptional regulator [Pedobacter petrophilus]MRX75054.1 helix-turn-helix domain-containing protein [Pedobacter petrophilus]